MVIWCQTLIFGYTGQRHVLNKSGDEKMNILFFIGYVVVGAVLAIPYNYLAGWNSHYLIGIAITAPIFLCIWLVVAVLAGVIQVDRHRQMLRLNWRAAGVRDQSYAPWSLPIFWAWTIYMFLPVILRGIAALQMQLGYVTASSFLYTHRYDSLLYALVALVAFVIALTLLEVSAGST